LTKYLFILRPTEPLIWPMAIPFKNRKAYLKIWPFPRTRKLQLPGHFRPAGHGLHILFYGFEQRTSLALSEGGYSRTVCDSDIGCVGTSLWRCSPNQAGQIYFFPRGQIYSRLEPNSKTRGQKGQPFFPNLSAVTKSYGPVLRLWQFIKWQSSSLTFVAQQQNKYIIKDSKRTT